MNNFRGNCIGCSDIKRLKQKTSGSPRLLIQCFDELWRPIQAINILLERIFNRSILHQNVSVSVLGFSIQGQVLQSHGALGPEIPELSNLEA